MHNTPKAKVNFMNLCTMYLQNKIKCTYKCTYIGAWCTLGIVEI